MVSTLPPPTHRAFALLRRGGEHSEASQLTVLFPIELLTRRWQPSPLLDLLNRQTAQHIWQRLSGAAQFRGALPG